MDLQKTKQRIEETLNALIKDVSRDTYVFSTNRPYEEFYKAHNGVRPFEFVKDIYNGDVIVSYNQRLYKISLDNKEYMEEVFPHLEVVEVYV